MKGFASGLALRPNVTRKSPLPSEIKVSFTVSRHRSYFKFNVHLLHSRLLNEFSKLLLRLTAQNELEAKWMELVACSLIELVLEFHPKQ